VGDGAQNVNKPTALITGASAGIGTELARVFGDHGHDLVLTARRADRLEDLAHELGDRCSVTVVTADLARRKGVRRILDAVDEAGVPVDVLVNNAGVACSGLFQDQPRGASRSIMQVNMASLVALTEGLLPGMIGRGAGRILNVASVAGFQAVPGVTLYSATKAFVLSFSEGLAEDLRGTGITVTALCPGPTRTEMVGDIQPMERAGPFLASARDVALEGYRACMAGEVVRIPGFMNQAMVTWLQYQPRSLVRYFSGLAARSTFGAAVTGRSPEDHAKKGN
jgi:short-subunit dehydrogenase